MTLLFQEAHAQPAPAHQTTSFLVDEKIAWKRLRSLFRKIKRDLEDQPEEVIQHLRTAQRHIAGMYALQYIDTNGYGHRLQGIMALCGLLRANPALQGNENAGVLATLQQEAMRRYAIVESEMIPEDDEADEAAMDIDALSEAE